MANEKLIIEVSENGARIVSGRIGTIGTTAKTAGSSVDLLNKALGLIGGAVIIRGFVRLSDEFQNMTNRLRLVTGSTVELVSIQNELLSISNQTRTSFAANTEFFVRTSLAMNNLSLSTQQLLDLTKAISQATALSGASAQEATNAIRQLTQGLQSGQLRGEEFRSVSEQLPLILTTVADDMGLTIGQLREFAFEGKLTADVLAGALLRATEELQKQFDLLEPTIGQALTVLKNNTLALVGEFNRGSGFGQVFANTILLVAKNLDLLARIFATAAIAATISNIAKSIRGLTAALAANPFGFLATTLLLAASALVVFSNQITLSNNRAATVYDFLIVSTETFGNIVGGVFDNVAKYYGNFVDDTQKVGKETEGIFLQILRFYAKGIDDLISLLAGLKAAGIEIFKNFPAILADILIRALDGIRVLFQDFINAIIDHLNSLSKFSGVTLKRLKIDPLKNPYKKAGEELGKVFREAITEQVLKGGAGAEELLDSLIQQSEQRAQLSLSQNQLDAELQKRIAEERKNLQEGNLGIQQTSVFDGFAEGFKQLQKEVLDFSKQAERTLVNAFQSAEDAFVEFVMTGEFNFSKLIDSILADLVRLAARQALVAFIGAIGNAFGGSGGAFGSFFSAFSQGNGATSGRAGGGDFQAGQRIMVGERGPEEVIFGTSGTVVPNQTVTGASARQPEVNVSVVNVMDPEEITSALNTSGSEQVILNMIRRNPEAIKEALA